MVTVVLKVGVLGHTGSDFEVAISHMGHLSCPCEGVPVQSLEEEALAPTSHPLCACSHTLRLGGVALLLCSEFTRTDCPGPSWMLLSAPVPSADFNLYLFAVKPCVTVSDTAAVSSLSHSSKLLTMREVPCGGTLLTLHVN